ncbi:FliM/FliN family flagellar motor switch protein [Nioella nitratireducens]|uniref:FliM/FliN family flagellar motor switch protein n=1 Tax=Nioella nitratireducens TaxID=1287720 RepID=UPI0008FCFA39|nr:FliM/FliN family flagellar motor switch protein [Nioella nitratireducens]
MSSSGFNPGLRRKIRARGARAPNAPPRPKGVETALARALGKAGAPYAGLRPQATGEAPQWDVHVADLMAAMPENGLIALLEAGEDRRAVCLFDPGLVDALVEVQTTGRVDDGPGLARAPTRIDAALAKDFTGLFLGALEGELADLTGIDWPQTLTYGAPLLDARQLDLLLPERPYHLLRATLDLGGGAKTGWVLLAVPVTGAADPPDGPPPDDSAWRAAWREAVLSAPAALEAVLQRRWLPLHRIEALSVGDVLPLDRGDLAGVELCDLSGTRRFRARLGRVDGHRALRLTQGAGLTPPAPPPSAPAATPLTLSKEAAPPA